MKKIEIITNGRPSLEHLPKNEAKVFYSTLLNYVLEHYTSIRNLDDVTTVIDENGIMKMKDN